MSNAEPWTFPADVDGWLTEAEGRELAALAAGQDVLEIGAYCGLSTICMAQTAKTVTVIDPMDGRATQKPRNTEEEFWANARRYGVADKIRILRGTTLERMYDQAERRAHIPDGSIGFAFIDGDHSYRSVIVDHLHARSVLKTGGLVAFHDYNSPIDLPVTLAVNRILTEGAVIARMSGTLAVVMPILAPKPAVIPYLAIPTHDRAMDFQTHLSAAAVSQRYALYEERVNANSALSFNFNNLLADCLNKRASHGFTHFLMLHSDVGAQGPNGVVWSDVLTEYMERFGLGVISAAVRLKNDTGETSTALEDAVTEHGVNLQRLCLDHIGPLMLSDGPLMKDPSPRRLLINTGCMAIDVRQPWAEELAFHQHNFIGQTPQGFVADFEPEDWRMSRWLHERGVRYGVTTDVKCVHIGKKAY